MRYMLKTTGISQRDFCRFWHTLRYEIFLKGEVRHVETNGRVFCRRSLRRRLVVRTGPSGAGCRSRYGERKRRLYDGTAGEPPSTAAVAAGSSSHSCAAAHSAYTAAAAASAVAASGTAASAAAPSAFSPACAAAGQTSAGS